MKRVAVIGGGFGGLTAAAELAAAGHQVTIFEQARALGGKAQVVREGGFTFDTGPTLLTLPHVVRDVFERIGQAHLLPRLHRLPLHTRYAWRDGQRFECSDSLEDTIASAARFGEGDAYRRFAADAERTWQAAGEPYLEAPFEGFPDFLKRVMRRGASKLVDGMQLSTLDAWAARHFRSPQLRQFVGRFATYVGASPYEATGALAMIPHLERAYGVHHVEGGMAALVSAFERALQALGVTVRCGERARWERVRGELRCGPVGHEERFDALVINADPLGEEKPGSKPLAMSGYVLLLDVRAEHGLELAHHHVAFGGDYRTEFGELFSGRPPSDPTVYFCHPAATDRTVAPAGRAGVFVMANAPAFTSAREEAAWSEWAPRLREQCLDALRAAVPGLLRSDVRVVAERTPVDLAQLGAPGGSIYGFLPHGRLAAFQRPRQRSSTPGVFYAGGSVHPGGGVPMVMRSGHFAAQYARSLLERGGKVAA
ncbi:MAG: phytoene desaturase family protein [Myxococcaceae bacterium]